MGRQTGIAMLAAATMLVLIQLGTPVGSALNATGAGTAGDGGSAIVRQARGTVNDIVSRNITMVLENLLMNYENSQLPTHGKGIPTVVKTNIYIRSMGPISELDMDYSMDCYFRQYWRDTRLSFLGPIKSLSLSIKMLERIWRPDTYFYNGKNSYVHTITVPNKLLRITQEGDILYSMRRLHVRRAGLRMEGQLERELRPGHGSVAVRSHGISLSESHLRETGGRVLGPSSVFQYAAAYRILSHSSLCSLHPHSGAQLGLLLDPSRGDERSRRTRNYDGADSVDDQSGLAQGSAQS